MRTFPAILSLAICCLFFSTPINAQGGFALVDYMKVKPGMWDKYLECEKAWKLVHQERKRQGRINGWSLEQVMWPSGTGTEYDFLAVTFVKSWDDIGKLQENFMETALQAVPADKRELLQNTGQYCDRVKSEIWAELDFIAKPGFSGAKYVVENFFKVPAGGWNDYLEMETRFVKPVHQKNIELGNRSGWVLTRLVAPSGAAEPYDCSAVDLFDKWEDMDNEQDGKAWEAVYPGMSGTHIGSRINSVRTHVRTEVRMVVDSTEE